VHTLPGSPAFLVFCCFYVLVSSRRIKYDTIHCHCDILQGFRRPLPASVAEFGKLLRWIVRWQHSVQCSIIVFSVSLKNPQCYISPWEASIRFSVRRLDVFGVPKMNETRWGTVKKLFRTRMCAPYFLNCFRHHCSLSSNMLVCVLKK